MKILTIHKHLASRHDFCAGTEGEIAVQPLDVAEDTQRVHVGIESLKPSTTVKVRATKLSIDEMILACSGLPHAAELVESSISVAQHYPIGAVLSPLFDRAGDEWVYLTREPTKPIVLCSNCF